MNNLKPILFLLTISISLFNHPVFGQVDIDFIHGKWDLNKKTVDGKIVLDYAKNSDSVLVGGEVWDPELRYQRYIHFFRGNFGQNSGKAVSNLTKSDKQFSLASVLGSECLDSISYTYANKVLNGYSLPENILIMSMNLRKIDEKTIELSSYTTNSNNETFKTIYILKRDENVKLGSYLPWSPKCSIILKQNEENNYASNIGSSKEKEVQLKKKDFSIVVTSIPRKSKRANFGIHIAFSESLQTKDIFEQYLNQEDNPYLKSASNYKSTALGYENLNISKSYKTHFLYYANKNDFCGEPIGSWMSMITEWKINTYHIDESYQVKRNIGSIKKMPYDILYMHVFFDSNQNGVIENAEYSCTKLVFK